MSEWQRLAAAIVAVGLLLLMYIWIRRFGRDRGTRFTPEAQRAIGFARLEAGRLGSPQIESIHVLLGLLHVQAPPVNRLLSSETRDSIRQEVGDHLTPGQEIPQDRDLPYSEEARAVLVAAAREAGGLSAPKIGAEHLLLGLLHSETSLAALILRERGVRLETLRAELGGWQS